MNDFAVLNTGRKMPLLGLGTWKSEPGKVRATLISLFPAKNTEQRVLHVYYAQGTVVD